MFPFAAAQIQRPPNSIVYLCAYMPCSTKRSVMWLCIPNLICHEKRTNSSDAKNCVTTIQNCSTRIFIPVWFRCAAWNWFVSTAKTITMIRLVSSRAKWVLREQRSVSSLTLSVRFSLGPETSFPRRFTSTNHCRVFTIVSSSDDRYSSTTECNRTRSDGE